MYIIVYHSFTHSFLSLIRFEYTLTHFVDFLSLTLLFSFITKGLVVVENGSGVVLDCIDSLSLPSSLSLHTHSCFTNTIFVVSYFCN